MSLIHGVMGKFPCPICLVPQDELFDLLKTWPLRTLHGAIHLLRKARKKPTKAKREQKLKSQSLRDVDVSHLLILNHIWNIWATFWPQQNALLKSKLVDVFCALSFDRLHTNHEGLEGKHLWNELQKLINDIGQGAASKIDEGFVNVFLFPCLSRTFTIMSFPGLQLHQDGETSTTSKKSWESASLMEQSMKTY